MNVLDAAIREGMSNRPPAQQDYIASYTRKKIIIDDLRKYAMKVYESEVSLPSSGFNATLFIVSEDPLTKEEQEIVDKMMTALKLSSRMIYYTHLNKIGAQEEDDDLNLMRILDVEWSVVRPDMVLTFGDIFKMGQSTPFMMKDVSCVSTLPLLNGEITVDEKKLIWRDVKHLVESNRKVL